MRYLYFLLLIFSMTIISCDKEDQELEEFLLKENLILDNLLDEWEWELSNGGFSGSVTLTPDTEGYNKTISFDTDRLYREYINSELSFETYFRIDTVVSKMHDYELYTIHFFNDKAKQNFVFDSINHKSSVVLYENDCRDCIGTHVYSIK